MNSGIHQWTCPGLMNKPTDKDQMHLSSDSVAIKYFFPLKKENLLILKEPSKSLGKLQAYES